MSIEPWINWQFHKTPGWIDPRASFTRAGSVGTAINRIGRLHTLPANTGRYRFHPISGLCEGLLVEPQRTNLVLWSEDFTNAAWTASNLTPTGNTTTAPDGNSTADTLAVTGAGGKISQAITITAGRGVAFGPYLKANGSSWAVLTLSDGTNSIDCWFNLASGAVGSHTAGGAAGGLSLLYAQAWLEPAGSGFYRCAVEATSSVGTTLVASIAPTSADNTASATGNSCFAWGAQAEADAILTNLTSYIPTTSATVTRSADNLLLPVSTSQVPLDRGTMVIEFSARPIPLNTGGQSIVMGGIGDTFSNTLYISRQGPTLLGYTHIQNGAAGVTNGRTCAFTPGTIYRYGVAWSATRIAHCIDGGTIGSQSLAGVMASTARFAVGAAPWSTSSAGTLSNMAHRAFLYAPITVPDALLQQLTAP